jgi:phosphoglycolate phosphatase-like HAD superfamily hydrolase
MIVFDIDGTLAIPGKRLKYLQQTPKNWDAFYEACGEDEPNQDIVELARNLEHFEEIIFVTGRRESTRAKTVAWLEEQELGIYEDNLFMRADGDYRHDTIVKPELVKDFMGKITMVFEDRTSMVKKWRELGLTCLQVAEGDF